MNKLSLLEKKEDLLSRHCNKQSLIDTVTDKLKKKGCTVVNTESDADVDIVKTAIMSSKSQSTTLIGEDTDLLILLLYHAETNGKDLYFCSDKATIHKVYDICQMTKVMGRDVLCSQLLFIHSFTGCDTTSRIFSIGKKSALPKIAQRNSTIHSCVNAFLLPNQTNAVIEDLGMKMMAVMFGGNSEEPLTSLRYKMFKKNCFSQIVCHPRTPPLYQLNIILLEFIIRLWYGLESKVI